jgi:threonine dehydratase
VIPYVWIEEAAQRIKDLTVKTPVIYDPALDLFLKLENHQRTGSFKLRGASNKVLSLTDWELSGGVITCSAGNHGQGVALASELIGTQCTVFVPEHAAQVKIDAMKKHGAQIVVVNGGYVDAEKAAIEYSAETKKTFISPYNDVKVISGQGTVALEIIEHFHTLETIKSLLIPIGGGGLICGIGAAIEEHRNKPRLIGVQSEASAFAYQLLLTGNQTGVVERDSIAEGLAGEIDHDSITIPLIKKYVDEIILVSEEEIKEAIRYAWKTYGEMIEGSAAVGLAARLAGKIQSHPALTVITGGNIQPELFHSIIMDI